MASPQEPVTVSISVLAPMFAYLKAQKVDTDALLSSLGIDPVTIKFPDARIPLAAYLLIQDEAARFTGDLCIGLHAGEFAREGSWPILNYSLMNCRTLQEAFEKSGRYQRITGRLIEASVEFHLNRVKVVFFSPPHAPKLSRHCFESILSSSVCMMRMLTGTHLHPLEVRLSYPRPISTAEYRRIFCCPVYFVQKENSFTVDWNTFQAPVQMTDSGLLEYSEQHRQKILAEMEPNSDFMHAVICTVLAHIDDEKLSIEKIAREMAVSVRTLQNHLEEEGVVFTDLLRRIRERLARQYLREHYSIEEITYLLGFPEPDSFCLAFQKWTGVTPGVYREAVSLPTSVTR